jgi:hypothetical protein
VRNPIEVSESLRVRNMREGNQWGLGYAPVMWAQYLATIEAATRNSQRAMLTYDELLTDWRAVVARVADDLDVTWPRTFGEVGTEIDAFLDQGERHHNVRFDAAEAVRTGVPDLVVRMYMECLAITRRKTDWHRLIQLVDEYFAAADIYSGALDNLLSRHQALEARVMESENGRTLVEAVLELKYQELGEYQRQAKTYDDLLREANAQSAAQAVAFGRDLAAYREQAQTYDDLLREANGRVESLTRQLQEQTEAFERNLTAYREQAQTYDDLLREANGRIESLTKQIQRVD